MLNFNLGIERKSTLASEVRVSAPYPKIIEEIIIGLEDLGAVACPQFEVLIWKYAL